MNSMPTLAMKRMSERRELDTNVPSDALRMLASAEHPAPAEFIAR